MHLWSPPFLGDVNRAQYYRRGACKTEEAGWRDRAVSSCRRKSVQVTPSGGVTSTKMAGDSTTWLSSPAASLAFTATWYLWTGKKENQEYTHKKQHEPATTKTLSPQILVLFFDYLGLFLYFFLSVSALGRRRFERVPFWPVRSGDMSTSDHYTDCTSVHVRWKKSIVQRVYNHIPYILFEQSWKEKKQTQKGVEAWNTCCGTPRNIYSETPSTGLQHPSSSPCRNWLRHASPKHTHKRIFCSAEMALHL